MFASLANLACAERPPGFSGESAWAYLVRQCEFGPRPPGSAAHDSVLAFIIGELRRGSSSVRLQRFEVEDPYGAGPLALTNVIASFAPERKERVLIAAHYDTRPWADQETDEDKQRQPILGANDGASGVAVLLELARILSKRTPPHVGVDLVFFDGEDYGREGDLEFYLLGSKYFGANLRGYRPKCGVVLDMVGAEDARIRQEGNSLARAPRLTEYIFQRAGALALDVFVPESSQPIYDDHIPLLQAGIPTVDLIGLPYPHWHTLEDTPDKCSVETLGQVGTLMVDLIYNFGF